MCPRVSGCGYAGNTEVSIYNRNVHTFLHSAHLLKQKQQASNYEYELWWGVCYHVCVARVKYINFLKQIYWVKTSLR